MALVTLRMKFIDIPQARRKNQLAREERVYTWSGGFGGELRAIPTLESETWGLTWSRFAVSHPFRKERGNDGAPDRLSLVPFAGSTC